MDIALLVKVLAPALPGLLGLGQKAIKKGAEKLGEKGAEGLAGKVWQWLKPKVEAKVEAKPAAIEAAADVAKAPEDEDAIAALRQQLKKILEDPKNAGLKTEISQLLAESEEVKGGKYNVMVGDDAIVGAIGDRNTVTQTIGSRKFSTTQQRLVMPTNPHVPAQMLQDNSVGTLTSQSELTTQEAADLLKVSLPYLIKQMEAGLIPHHKIGKHRRIYLNDLMAYQEQTERVTLAALAEMTEISQDLGLYD